MAQNITLIGGIHGAPQSNERLAASANILPGHLVAEALGKVDVNAAADALGQKLFAQCDLTVAGDIDTAYAINSVVSYGAYASGQKVSAVVAAGADAIADGAPVASAGDGTLKIGTVATAIGYAVEAVDNSAGATSVRLSIRVA